MKQSTYNVIIKTIQMGKKVAVRHTDDDWKVFLYQMPDGDFQGTRLESTIKKSLKLGLNECTYSREEMLEDFTDEIIINDLDLNPVPWMPKAGGKVMVLENIRKFTIDNGCISNVIAMIGQSNLEVKEIDSDSSVVIFEKDKKNYWTFPLWAIAPAIEEESKETIKIGDQTYFKSEFEEATKNLKPIE